MPARTGLTKFDKNFISFRKPSQITTSRDKRKPVKKKRGVPKNAALEPLKFSSRQSA